MKTDSIHKNSMSPLKSTPKVYDFVGFDVETYNVNGVQTFYFGSLYYYNDKGQEITDYYFCKEEFIKNMLSLQNKNKYIVATNLGFDFSSLFYNTKYWNDITIIWRGSDIIMCSYKLKNKKGKIKMIDTFNYVGFSVEKLGSIIGLKKQEKPEYMGHRKSKNNQELNYFLHYNKFDSKISCDFMYFIQKTLNHIGGEFKLTGASASLDVFRRGFMKGKWIKEDFTLDCKIENVEPRNYIRKAYYGGRTEVFTRGKVENINYYDINSLYPAMMLKELPNPNSVFIPKTLDILNIMTYEGVSHVDIETPHFMRYPILPYRTEEGKLIFPLGEFSGYYNHNELQFAIKNGYKVRKIHSHICYSSTFKPFKQYVEKLYNMRLQFKKEKNPMEYIVKLLLNSLYGKFGQSKKSKVTMIDTNLLSPNDKAKYLLKSEGDVKDNFVIINEEEEFNGVHCFPIIASYITSYARMQLYYYLSTYEAVYCDTDSIMTSHQLPESPELGKMKLEGKVKYGEFYKPKTYFLEYENSKQEIKMKGINRASYEDFISLKNSEPIKKHKMTKIRESIRRGMSPNTFISIDKNLSLEDTKRDWVNNDSTPIILNNINVEEI